MNREERQRALLREVLDSEKYIRLNHNTSRFYCLHCGSEAEGGHIRPQHKPDCLIYRIENELRGNA